MTVECKTPDCINSMLKDMYKSIEGTELLLEKISSEFKSNNKSEQAESENAFKILIGTVLSVRTKDETTEKIIESLWTHYSTPQQLSEAPVEEVETIIRSSGFYHQKTLHIKEIARIIHEDYHDKVPSDLDKLLELPGVGRKVANCVLVFAFNKPAIPVDTHVHRISNRTGWVKTKDPDDTEQALMKLFPEELWLVINSTLVAFGKEICKPINPLCLTCPVSDRCPKLIDLVKKKSKKMNQKSSKNKK
jgi:endonuclease-3